MVFYENKVYCLRSTRSFCRFSHLFWSFLKPIKRKRDVHLYPPRQEGILREEVQAVWRAGPFYLLYDLQVTVLLNRWRQAPEHKALNAVQEALGHARLALCGPHSCVWLSSSLPPTLGWGLCVAAETKGQVLQLEQSMWKKKLLEIHLPWYKGLLFSGGAN